METVVQDQQVAIINNSIELFRSAPEILKANQERSRKAISVGNSILAQWHEAWAIEDEEEKLQALAAVDERSNKYLVNCSTALKEEKEARAAITQMMDAFKKMFTEAESDLDRTKAGTVTNKVQNNRDTYVSEVANIQERKRKEAERIAAKAKEAVQIKHDLEIDLRNQYSAYLLRKKTAVTNAFNAITLDDFNEKAAGLKGYEPKFAFIIEGPYTSSCYLHTNEELAAFATEVKEAVIPELQANYTAEMNLLKDELVDKLPSKLAELKEQKRLADEAEAERKRQQEEEDRRQAAIAKANAAEKARLEEEARIQREKDQQRMEQLRREQEKAMEEQRQREAEENARLAREAEEAKRQAELEAEAKKQAEQTMVMFEQEAMTAEVTPAPEARQGYEITVLHQAGYVQIFTLWFEKEGKNLPVDKLGNTKLDQMKAWAEKHAHKTGEKIESKFLRYDESYKAVNRKAK